MIGQPEIQPAAAAQEEPCRDQQERRGGQDGQHNTDSAEHDEEKPGCDIELVFEVCEILHSCVIIPYPAELSLLLVK